MEHFEEILVKNDKQIHSLETFDVLLKKLTWMIIDSGLRGKQKDVLTPQIFSLRMSILGMMEKIHEEGNCVEEIIKELS